MPQLHYKHTSIHIDIVFIQTLHLIKNFFMFMPMFYMQVHAALANSDRAGNPQMTPNHTNRYKQ